MKKSILLLATIAALAPCFHVATNAATGPCAADPQVYDLKTDWSDTQNPNGRWSYRVDEGLMSNNPFPWVSNPFFPEAGYITRITPVNAVAGVLEAGDISSGATDNNVGVRWTSPASGVITISAIMWNAGGGGDLFSGRPWELTHNGNVISNHPIGTDTPRSSPFGLSLLNSAVQAGDQIELRFTAGGLIGFNLTVTLTPESGDNLFAADSIIWHQPLARNGGSEDTDPSASRTVKYRFKRGSTIPIQVHGLGCDGGDVTSSANVIGKVIVFGDSNCDGAVDGNDAPIDFNGVGGGGGVMDKIGGHLKYNLDTKSLPTTTQCYILRVTVTDTSTGEEKFEEVLLQVK